MYIQSFTKKPETHHYQDKDKCWHPLNIYRNLGELYKLKTLIKETLPETGATPASRWDNGKAVPMVRSLWDHLVDMDVLDNKKVKVNI